MSGALVFLAWSSTIKEPTKLAVLDKLCNFAGDDGENCFPGHKLLAGLARCSERTVIRTLKELEAEGWISIEKKGNGRGNRARYVINVEKLKGCQDVTLQPRGKRAKKGDIGDSERVTLATGKGDIGDNPPHPLFGRTSMNQIQEPAPCNPPQAGDGLRAVENAVVQVMSGLSLTKRRDRRWVRAVIELEVDKGEPPPTVALAMMHAEKRQREARRRGDLTSSYGVQNFFERGVWRDEGRWHWNEEVLRKRAEAGTGSR